MEFTDRNRECLSNGHQWHDPGRRDFWMSLVAGIVVIVFIGLIVHNVLVLVLCGIAGTLAYAWLCDKRGVVCVKCGTALFSNYYPWKDSE